MCADTLAVGCLQCVMEVFIFMSIKGSTRIQELSSQLTIKLLGEDATAIGERLMRFEAAKAQWYATRSRSHNL